MQKSSKGEALPSSPEEFHPELPPGIRAALIEFVLREINRDFMFKAGEIVDEFIQQNPRLDRPTAFLWASDQIQKQIKPYQGMPERILSPMRITLSNALDLEKSGQADGAIVLFEKLVADSFPAFTPYERLRILYTRQHFYEDAIRVCQRYVEVLTAIQEFDLNFHYADFITKYEGYIEKLKQKTGGVSRKPKMLRFDKDKNIIES